MDRSRIGVVARFVEHAYCLYSENCKTYYLRVAGKVVWKREDKQEWQQNFAPCITKLLFCSFFLFNLQATKSVYRCKHATGHGGFTCVTHALLPLFPCARSTLRIRKQTYRRGYITDRFHHGRDARIAILDWEQRLWTRTYRYPSEHLVFDVR